MLANAFRQACSLLTISESPRLAATETRQAPSITQYNSRGGATKIFIGIVIGRSIWTKKQNATEQRSVPADRETAKLSLDAAVHGHRLTAARPIAKVTELLFGE